MAKVGKIRVVWGAGAYGTEYELHYTQKEKFNVKGLPEEFLRLTGFRPFGYLTESELDKYIYVDVQKYRAMISSERKVIMFRIRTTPIFRMNQTGDGSFSGTKNGISKAISDSKFGVLEATLEIEYKLANEMFDGGKKYYEIGKFSGETKSQISMSPSEFQIMDWTEERELFFKGMYESMEKIVMKLSSFFGNDIDTVIKSIDSASSNTKLIN